MFAVSRQKLALVQQELTHVGKFQINLTQVSKGHEREKYKKCNEEIYVS